MVGVLGGGGAASGESAQYHVGHCPADHRFGVCRGAFVITGQAAAHGDPGERPLYRPTLWLDLEVPLSGVSAYELKWLWQAARPAIIHDLR